MSACGRHAKPNGSIKQRGSDLDAAAEVGVLNVREPKDAMTESVTDSMTAPASAVDVVTGSATERAYVPVALTCS